MDFKRSSYNNSPIVFENGTEMDIHGIPVIIDEPLRNKYGRFSLFMIFIVILFLIILYMISKNIKKEKKERTYKSKQLYNSYLRDRKLCQSLYNELDIPSSRYIEILIDPEYFLNINNIDLNKFISSYITIYNNDEFNIINIGNTKWHFNGKLLKTYIDLNNNKKLRSITLNLDKGLLSKLRNDSLLIIVNLYNKIEQLIWKKISGYPLSSFINIEIDHDLYL
jgi:hypothetical protein